MLDPNLESTTASNLEAGERVVLWSVRMRLEGAAAFDPIRESFRVADDEVTAETAFDAFEPWYLILANHCRRDIHLHRPRCPCLSEDERDLLALIAHIQQGDGVGAHRFAASLVYERAMVAFLAASLTFAHALTRLQLRLPQRSGSAPSPSRRMH